MDPTKEIALATPTGSLPRLEQAIQVAAVAHAGQFRKGTEIPYLVHPVAVAMMLQRAGCDEDVVIAGLLHDTLEDTSLDAGVIRERFGERVLALVQSCSEPQKSAPWEDRKRHTLALLESAAPDVRLVACADKLHNIRSIACDSMNEGEGFWQRFRRGKESQGWYYRSLVALLCREPLPE
ncbi:MAG: bifunctional (p)ppGpp synthetase/guanosine-3',5'-bis(diphosphate) 3'-pyrophosphohydrolase [Candidatus Riflebacteria bacterium]|nr:bifunctional (p)ppGpp synthetase/guanosine-3',5'-bis(diphosphate) 3'-pyrophosphohydrolase [Candidatus Riflebacteria bacterium]